MSSKTALPPPAGLLADGARHVSPLEPAGMLNDQVPATKHAISLARLPQGWRWELIDTDGVTTAMGVATYQKVALGMARRATGEEQPCR